MALKPRTTTVVIYQGDDLERLGELRQEADTAQRIAQEAARGPRREGDDIPSAKGAKDAYDAFVEEASERAEMVTIQAIGRKRFRDLSREHPPRMVERDGEQVMHEDDADFGVNVETFADALLTYRDPGGTLRTVVSPDFPTRAEVQSFLDDDISEGDGERLWVAAYWLNKALGNDPKALRYSMETVSSNET